MSRNIVGFYETVQQYQRLSVERESLETYRCHCSECREVDIRKEAIDQKLMVIQNESNPTSFRVVAGLLLLEADLTEGQLFETFNATPAEIEKLTSKAIASTELVEKICDYFNLRQSAFSDLRHIIADSESSNRVNCLSISLFDGLNR